MLPAAPSRESGDERDDCANCERDEPDEGFDPETDADGAPEIFYTHGQIIGTGYPMRGGWTLYEIASPWNDAPEQALTALRARARFLFPLPDARFPEEDLFVLRFAAPSAPGL
ncbi:hypothetical protein [Acrocarpospora sp. B8E8]|uniref:hypothetical protein n=1 Tax=Acrocarpospora sp. B8E8 TaxID=3153572 RepID=UPI00325D0A44